jgi:hypothetical protein
LKHQKFGVIIIYRKRNIERTANIDILKMCQNGTQSARIVLMEKGKQNIEVQTA